MWGGRPHQKKACEPGFLESTLLGPPRSYSSVVLGPSVIVIVIVIVVVIGIVLVMVI